MEFFSKFGYNYGFEGSDEEDFTEENKSTKRKIRKADSNILSIKIDKLIDSKNEPTSIKAIKCNSCSAFLTNISKQSIKEEINAKIWTCEFCSEPNIITNYDDRIVLNNDVTYLLEPAVKKEEKPADGSDIVSLNNNYFTLCIDTSGSMGTGIQTTLFKAVSRLDAVKSACIENLKKLKLEEPNKKAILVTFSNSIKYYGDSTKLQANHPLIEVIDKSNFFSGFGLSHNRSQLINYYENDVEMTNEEEIVSETLETLLKKQNLLSNSEDIIKIAELTDDKITGISKSFEKLVDLIKNLRDEGGTALGPALVYSVGLCKSLGSQICLVTDGQANIGVGSVEGNNELIEYGEQFYELLANYAKNKGITINVITVEGTDCKLAILGKLADITNGNLNIVNPMNLGEELKFILNNRIKATNVKVKLIVYHKYLYIRDESLEKAQSKAFESNDKNAKEQLEKIKKSILTKEIGAAKNDSEIFFEYGIKRVKNEDKSIIDELPFQIQIEYVSPDGSKSVRVLSHLQPFTSSRTKAETNLNSTNLFFTNATQKMARQVLNNNVMGSLFSCQSSTAMANRLNLQQPACFGFTSNAVTGFGASNLSAFGKADDKTANFIYGFAKCSSTQMSNFK